MASRRLAVPKQYITLRELENGTVVEDSGTRMQTTAKETFDELLKQLEGTNGV